MPHAIHTRSRGIASKLLLAILLISGTVAAEMIHVAESGGPTGVHLQAAHPSGVELRFAISRFSIEDVVVGGERMQAVVLPGALMPNKPGAPDLPSISCMLAAPRDASVSIEILHSETRTYTDIDLAPASRVPNEHDDPIERYERDPAIYERNANYPETPIALSHRRQMRGIDTVTMGVTPFQYNPVTRELIVHTELVLRVNFAGGNGEFGEARLRSRYWEPLLRNHLLNYDMLPPADFGRPGGGRDGTGCEYVILIPDHPDFASWADTLKNWRQLQGISTEVYTTTDIGGGTATAIESFLDTAYGTWDPAPAAFLILADYPEEPYPGIEAPVWNDHCISDNIYADVDGDSLPDMVAGRICARDANELATMIGKMLAYERAPYTDPGFYDHPVTSGGWQDDRWYVLCTEIVNGFQELVLGKSPVRENAIHWGTPGDVWSTNVTTPQVVSYFGPEGLGYIPATPEHLTDWDADAGRLNADINAGTFLVVHRDHALEENWITPNYSVNHMDGLTNTMFPFVLSINCRTGRFNHEVECFTEKLHRLQTGALGVIAGTEQSYSFVNDALVWGVFDGLWPQFDPGYGDSTQSVIDLRTAFALASGKYYLANSGFPFNENYKAHTYYLFHHHGDAFMQLYSEIPQALTVVHDDRCPLYAENFAVQADTGAVIGLTIDGEIVGVAIASGEAQDIAITPPTAMSELRITVTKANYFRYDVSVPIEVVPVEVRADGTGAYPTIQAAIDASGPIGIIELADGTFTGEGNRDLDFLGKSITLRSQDRDPEACIIDCEGTAEDLHRGFFLHSGEDASAVIQNLTVRNGYVSADSPPGDGGAVLLQDASPRILGCTFSNNQALRGGAIFAQNCTSLFSGCVFTTCVADSGGALCLADTSAIEIFTCAFQSNEATVGGGLLCIESSAANVSGTTFTANTAQNGGAACFLKDAGGNLLQCLFEANTTSDSTGTGGAIVCVLASPTIEHCRFFSNVADSAGGALFCIDAMPTISYAIFSGDSAEHGGALWLSNSSPQISFSTFYGNGAHGLGGSFYLTQAAAPSLSNTIISFGTLGEAVYCDESGGACCPEVVCCDFYGNDGGDWTGCVEERFGTDGNISLDPAFCGADSLDFYLYNYSPCLQEGCGQIGALGQGCEDVQDIDIREIASRLHLGYSLPNPFSARTQILYHIPPDADRAPVVLEVFDLSGRLVRTLVEGPQVTGEHVVSWDGTGRRGERLASGVYYYQLKLRNERLRRPVVLLR